MLTAIMRFSLVFSLALLFFTGSAAAQYQNGIPVLLYHHVNPDETDMPALNLSPAEFEKQIRQLAAAGFKTISPVDLISYMQGETVKLPEKPLLITFDDGYADNYTYAFPILKKYGYTATIFMVGVNFDRPERLSSREIREMQAAGFVIGGHTMTHPDLTALSGAKLQSEIEGCKAKAESKTRKQVRFFAYSGGFYNLSTVNEVENAGYSGAFTVLTGLNKAGFDNPYMLRRIPVFSFTDFDAILALLDKNQPKTSLLNYDETIEE